MSHAGEGEVEGAPRLQRRSPMISPHSYYLQLLCVSTQGTYIDVSKAVKFVGRENTILGRAGSSEQTRTSAQPQPRPKEKAMACNNQDSKSPSPATASNLT